MKGKIVNMLNEHELTYQDDHILCFSSPTNDHILWEITGSCNLNCKYCYDSRTRHNNTSKQTILNTAYEIKNSDINVVHLSGGEPFLCPYLSEVLTILTNKDIYITTNLTNLDSSTENILLFNNIKSIAISLDSIDETINDFLRGNTDDVKSNILRLLAYREKYILPFQIRIHCVITKINIDSILDLMSWAYENHIDEVSCQPVSLLPTHKYYDTLSLTNNNISQIGKIFDLEEQLFHSNYAKSHKFLTNVFLSNGEIGVFSHGNVCMPFIDAYGKYWSCPLKKVALESIGSIQNNTNKQCVLSIQCFTCLKHFSFKEKL